jgi:hypothetical protein
MTNQIFVGPYKDGLQNNFTAFNIADDAFPTLINAYQWRERVKRKRGTSFLARLTRYFDSTSSSYNSGSATITLDGSGNGNLLTGWSLETDASLVPGSVVITGGAVYTDPSEDGTLDPSGSINYASGAITIAAEAGMAVSATFLYYPDLPVMGLPNWVRDTSDFPSHLGFDTTYSYFISNAFPYPVHDISFFKNPSSPDASLPGYTEKTVVTPVSWNGENYQQFWSLNYLGALWTTNGIKIPFSTTNIGMQFQDVTDITFDAAGPPAIATFTFSANHNLQIGDFLFFNEFDESLITGLNFQTGYVIAVPAANQVQVEFPQATLAGPDGAVTQGIAQYLTARIDETLDCIRWFDGDPTNGSATAPVLDGHKGWVNFCPPLSISNFNVGERPAAQYYLVGGRMLSAFKDRLVVFGPVIQTSSADSQIYLQDAIIYSQNGTPYYTVSFTGDPTLATTEYSPILVPDNQTATPNSWWEDQTGFGGFQLVGVDQPITTVSSNEDVLIVGLLNIKIKLVYTGNDVQPFNFFSINAEYGDSSTFGTINMDEGVLTRGTRGYLITSQNTTQRIDLKIPDEVFQIKAPDNGSERFTAIRDFINEWVYFTFPANNIPYVFPTETLLYNYRDQSWAILVESYTAYGIFSPLSGYIWENIGLKYATWEVWTDPWNSGTTSLLQPQISAGNQQGFIMLREQGTNEGKSLYIQQITNNVVTSPDHCLNEGDFIIISDALGSVADDVNEKIFSVQNPDDDTFSLNPSIPSGTTYLGLGKIKRMYVPQIQSKQFPVSWGMGRKTRLGAQKYLFTKTVDSEVTIQIFLSQNGSSPYNNLPIYPDPNAQNDSLIYTNRLFTSPDLYIQNCPDIPLGSIGNGVLTTIPFNLQTQFSFSNPIVSGSVSVLVNSIASFEDDGAGGFSVTGTGVSAGSSINYSTGQIVLVFSVPPSSEATTITFQYYQNNILSPTAEAQAQIWHRMNTSLIGDTVQFGITLSEEQMRDEQQRHQFAEIELHAAILNVSPSQELA